jgi:hypothetical protein
MGGLILDKVDPFSSLLVSPLPECSGYAHLPIGAWQEILSPICPSHNGSPAVQTGHYRRFLRHNNTQAKRNGNVVRATSSWISCFDLGLSYCFAMRHNRTGAYVMASWRA